MKRKIRFGFFLKIIITIIILSIIIFFIKSLIQNPDSITTLAKSTGNIGPIILILLIALGILFTPIPSFILIITAGYVYGIWQGALYSYIGHLLAAIGTFAAMKFFKIKNKSERYEKYKNLIKKNKKALYLLYSTSLIPVSILSILSESSKMSWKEFLRIIFISFIPPVIFFSIFGNRISNQNIMEISIFLILIIIGTYFALKRIRKLIHYKRKKRKRRIKINPN